MAALEIVPFADAHLDAAAALLAARHDSHREAEPLLPGDVDFRAELEREWRPEGASGASFAGDALPDRERRASPPAISWMRVGVAGQAIEGDPEPMRDLYAAAAQRWVDEGQMKHAVFVPAHDRELVDAWFRLSFGASARSRCARRGRGAVRRPGRDPARTPDDFDEAARLELAMSEAMRRHRASRASRCRRRRRSPPSGAMTLTSSQYELFVAERDGRVVGHFLLYRRPPRPARPDGSIDLAQASTEPEARGHRRRPCADHPRARAGRTRTATA